MGHILISLGIYVSCLSGSVVVVVVLFVYRLFVVFFVSVAVITFSLCFML